jgi:hypothetical protein
MSRGDRAVVSGNLSNSMRANYELGIDEVCTVNHPSCCKDATCSPKSTMGRLGQLTGTRISLEFDFASLHGSTGKHPMSVLDQYFHADLGDTTGGGRWKA